MTVSIGNRPVGRFGRARARLEHALGERGFIFDRFERRGGAVVAIAVDGNKVLAHLGRDEADAMYNLARLAASPEGRA